MDENTWGPIAWRLLHKITLNYNRILKDKYIIFFENFHSMIPCPYCSNDFENMMTDKKLSPRNVEKEFDSSYFKWMIHIHDVVNHKLKKNGIHINEALIMYNEPLNLYDLFEFLKYSFTYAGFINSVQSIPFLNAIEALCYILPIKKDKINIESINLIKKQKPYSDSYKLWLTKFMISCINSNLVDIEYLLC